MHGDWLSYWLSWIPGFAYALIFVGLMVWYSRRAGLRSRGPSGVTMIEICEQQVAEMQRTNAVLERIAATLDKRSPG